MNNNNPFPKVSSISQRTISRIIILVGILFLGLIIFGIIMGISPKVLKSNFKGSTDKNSENIYDSYLS